jgi:Sulfotransferase domain
MSKSNHEQGLSDFPAAIFYQELITAYPSAHIILTVRPEDDWFASIKSTLYHAYQNFPKTPLASAYHHHIWKDDFPNTGPTSYREHNQGVRDAAEGHNFLEYSVSEGWEPLCEFLGKPVPEGNFPRSDDWAAYKAEHHEK